MKILIVEDSLLQATQIQILLKRYSVDEVYTAYNGEDAIELCKQHRFDIAFCDLQLPIQKIAPAPPRYSATATPAMLPVPTREARLVHSA